MMNMMLGKAVIWVVVAGALFSGIALAQDFQGLRDAMTPEELESAGLDNLSPEQQQFLDGWLRQRFSSPPSAGAVGQTATHDLDPRKIHDGSGSVAAGDNGANDAAVTGSDAIEAEIERRVALEVNAAIAKAAEEDAAEEAARMATRDEPFEADIVGPFSGWGGKTVFTLSNGQVWRQRTGSNYRHTADGQTVAVKKELYGVMDADGTLFGPHGGGLPD